MCQVQVSVLIIIKLEYSLVFYISLYSLVLFAAVNQSVIAYIHSPPPVKKLKEDFVEMKHLEYNLRYGHTSYILVLQTLM